VNDSLGDRMKTYEQVTRSFLLPHSLTILRVDGRSFSSYLRQAAKPFDLDFMYAMGQVGKKLCEEISGSVFAYGQSDEISVLMQDLEPQSQPWFGGVIQKMVSVAAGIATAQLIVQLGTKGFPHFDARVFTLPNATEVANYFLWRQRDAVRNSVSMAAQAKFSHSQLHGKTSGQMQEMLFSEYGINWNDYPDACKRGWITYRQAHNEPVTFIHKRTQQVETIDALRTVVETRAAPHFSVPLLQGWMTGEISMEPKSECELELAP
jgi:tRNA(His) 5'-end guanylyltransferase